MKGMEREFHWERKQYMERNSLEAISVQCSILSVLSWSGPGGTSPSAVSLISMPESQGCAFPGFCGNCVLLLVPMEKFSFG